MCFPTNCDNGANETTFENVGDEDDKRVEAMDGGDADDKGGKSRAVCTGLVVGSASLQRAALLSFEEMSSSVSVEYVVVRRDGVESADNGEEGRC